MRGRSCATVAARGFVVVAVVVAAAAGVAGLARPALRPVFAVWGRHGLAGVAGLRFDELLTALCAAASVACSLWLVLVAWLLVAEAVVAAAAGTPRRLRHTSALVCPAPVRRALLAACGVAVATGLTAATAAAEPSGLGDPGTSVARTTRPRLGGLPLPDRTTGAVPPGSPAAVTVTVRPGDSLWAIAERLLPAAASDRHVAAVTRALYLRNTGSIGADPDLIQPGTRLRLPPPGPQHGKDQ